MITGVKRSLPVTDQCEICGGARGGVPGNENRVDGNLMCDYCHGDLIRTHVAADTPASSVMASDPHKVADALWAKQEAVQPPQTDDYQTGYHDALGDLVRALT